MFQKLKFTKELVLVALDLDKKIEIKVDVLDYMLWDAWTLTIFFLFFYFYFGQ